MLNQEPALRYRVKALGDSSPDNQVSPTSPSDQIEDPGKLMGQVFRCFRRPHLTDHLYHFANLNGLAKTWPTFAFLQPRRRSSGWIKTVPLHLAPYIGWPRPNNPPRAVERLLSTYDCQDDEGKLIQFLMDSVQNGDEPRVVEFPVAMGVACHLFRGSAWLRTNLLQIHDVVLRSTTASFIALASGAFANTKPLIDRVAENPRLVLEMAQSSILKQYIRKAWFTEALRPHPIFHALWLFMSSQELGAWILLRNTAERNPIAAGICLGLEPQHKKALDWFNLARKSYEALYWAGRVWQAKNNDVSKFNHNRAVASLLSRDPRWYYHWLRDFEFEDLNAKVREMWPNPWSIELIVDRCLSKELVTELCCKGNLDHKDPMGSAVLIWAKDYVES